MGNERGLPVIEQIDTVFRGAAVDVSTPPTHFYLNLIESCNIRCRHCITDAPEKTRLGTARTMPLEVLDALAPHLANAAYVGLTHAGEPITAPMLEPLLERLESARAGRPTVVHILTNGLALSERRFVELTSKGVLSWSFSVDGMSEATHDFVRIGSKISRLTERIRQLSKVRHVSFPNVRMGIAWTIMASNIEEIDALIRFSAEAKLDWVKLEELYPSNPFAEGERQVLEETKLKDAVFGAVRLGHALGIPVLDHTRPVDVWRCRFEEDAEMSRYSRLDDYVNRMEINPCRFPYEVVCIEPNGDVKPLQFERAPEGNLLERDLLEIWNAPGFRRVRHLTRQRRLCGDGPVTCARDVGPAAW